jgi:hypothetical protein
MTKFKTETSSASVKVEKVIESWRPSIKRRRALIRWTFPFISLADQVL